MTDKMRWRFLAVAVLVFILTLSILAFHFRESTLCMGVEVMRNEEDVAKLTETAADISEYIIFEEEKVAIDREINTIYISQPVTDETEYKDLQGKLEIALNEYTLKFAPDDMFDNMAQAVKQGYAFKLLAIKGSQYVKYDVVFTSLPIIKIDGGYSHMELEKEILTGSMTLWDPQDKALGRYSTKSTLLNWNKRGNTTALAYKKSWKLSLIDNEGNKKNMEFLGMGEDDDWILNSMTYDDTKLKEKLCMDLWNEVAKTEDYLYPMSTGEHIEVFINGEYAGLYLMQRRVDPKYLQLNDSDILIKGKNILGSPAVKDGYEINYSPLTEEDTYDILENIFYTPDYTTVDAENLAVTNLFLEFGAMPDNQNYKNIFYVLKDVGDGYRVYFIPWDTDMSFGVTWINNGFGYSKESSLGSVVYRKEMAHYAEQNAEIYNIMAEKWAQMRKGALSEENIYKILDESYNTLINGGAYLHNLTVESLRYGEENDTKQNMEDYIRQKLAIMDEKYIGQ